MRRMAMLLVGFMLSAPAFAVDLGRAEGAVTVDGNRIDLLYAYAIGHQFNELTHKKSDTRIVLTSKPLPDGIDLANIDESFPEDTMGVVLCITRAGKVSHVLVQHPKGMYDAGYFENDNYRFEPVKDTAGGAIAGKVTSGKIITNTMSFTLDSEFSAAVK